MLLAERRVVTDFVPRQSRIDARGCLQYVICRGIEGRDVFRDDTDRERFLERLAMSGAGVGERPGIGHPAVSRDVERGQWIVREMGWKIKEDHKA